MNVVYRGSKEQRQFAIFMLVCYTLFNLLYIAVPFLPDDPRRGPPPPLGRFGIVCMGCSVFGPMWLGCWYLFFSARVWMLSLTDDSIAQRTLRGLTTLRWQDIERVSYHVRPRGGSLTLTFAHEKTTIELYRLEKQADMLAFLRIVRDKTSHASEEGWPLFCHRYAVRWIVNHPVDCLPEFETHSTLSCDLIYLPLAIISTLIGVVFTWRWGDHLFWSAPAIAFFPLWLLSRRAYPKNTFRRAPLSKEEQSLQTWANVVLLIGLVCFLELGNELLRTPRRIMSAPIFDFGTSVLIGSGAIIVGFFIYAGIRSEQARTRRHLAEAAESIEIWNRTTFPS